MTLTQKIQLTTKTSIMNIQDFTEKAQDLVQSTDYKLQAIVLATDGKDISTVNYGTDDMRARMMLIIFQRKVMSF